MGWDVGGRECDRYTLDLILQRYGSGSIAARVLLDFAWRQWGFMVNSSLFGEGRRMWRYWWQSQGGGAVSWRERDLM